ncbi:MAG: cell division protein ZapA [Lachnospiraceae bacterium]|nr:cell division protein ZapA [Lachnospiraceae bacterium]
MEKKNYTEVLIDGNIYTLGGSEEQEYLQKVAAYINQKIGILKAQPGFTRQNKDYQEVMIYLNLADDYFKTLLEAKMLRAQKDELEKEVYSLKHELISVQMQLDAQMEKHSAKNER